MRPDDCYCYRTWKLCPPCVDQIRAARVQDRIAQLDRDDIDARAAADERELEGRVS